jgi:hypothetical protein
MARCVGRPVGAVVAPTRQVDESDDRRQHRDTADRNEGGCPKTAGRLDEPGWGDDPRLGGEEDDDAQLEGDRHAIRRPDGFRSVGEAGQSDGP